MTPIGSVPTATEVLDGDTKIVTEYKRSDDGKLVKVRPFAVFGHVRVACVVLCAINSLWSMFSWLCRPVSR